MATPNNKLHLYVQKSLNWWFMFHKGKYTIHLSGDSRKDGFILSQYAKKLGKDKFMTDFTEILDRIEKDNETIVRECSHLPKWHPDKRWPIAIFSLYVNEDKTI